jgi:hypothetical protein
MSRVLPAAVLVGAVPGYFWAKCLASSVGYVERIALSTAISMTLVPEPTAWVHRVKEPV